MRSSAKRQVVSMSVLGGAAIALAVFILLDSIEGRPTTLPELEVIDRVDAISVTRNAHEPVDLSLVNGAWFIEPEGYEANQALAHSLAVNIGFLQLSELVSISGDLARYDLDEQSRAAVTVTGEGGIQRTVYIGKIATTFEHTYVTLEGDNRVFQAEGNLHTLVSMDKDQFRNRHILQFPVESVAVIDAIYDGGSMVSVERASTNEENGSPRWTTDVGADVAIENVNRLLGFLSNLTCGAFRDEFERNREAVIDITLQAEHELHLSVFPERDKKHSAVSSESQYPFELAAWQIGMLRDYIIALIENS